MAILNIDTQQYYKLNFDECKIQGNRIYANYSIYCSVLDRDKDKQRFESMAIFNQKLREFISNGQNKINNELISFGINPYDINSDMSRIPTVRLEQLKSEGEYLANFLEIERKLPHKFFITNNEIAPTADIDSIRPILEGLGFQMNWITDPIHIGGKMEIYCCDYNGEKLEPSLFYAKMKEVILNSLIDC